MEQPALQKVLYDIEAGMPFLFVDQLDVQVPQTTAKNESASGRIRVVLGVGETMAKQRQQMRRLDQDRVGEPDSA